MINYRLYKSHAKQLLKMQEEKDQLLLEKSQNNQMKIMDLMLIKENMLICLNKELLIQPK